MGGVSDKDPTTRGFNWLKFMIMLQPALFPGLKELILHIFFKSKSIFFNWNTRNDRMLVIQITLFDHFGFHSELFKK